MIDTADAEWEIEVRPLKSIDIQCVMIANIEMQPTACRLWLISAMSPDAARLTTSGFTCQGKKGHANNTLKCSNSYSCGF